MKARYRLFIGLGLVLIGGLALSFGHKEKKKVHPAAIETATAACPTIDDSNVLTTPSTCNGSDGSITGITGTGTGTLKFTWYNFSHVVVGTTRDLINVPAGYYQLELKDSSKCLAATKPYYIDVKNPLLIDTSNIVITPPGCNQPNGSITGIVATNATQYQWTDSKGKVISNTKDLTNVVAGDYTFIASNATGCTISGNYSVTNGSYAPAIYYTTITNSDCMHTGAFTAAFNVKPTDPLYLYSITNSSGEVKQSGAIGYIPNDTARISLTKLAPDTYTLTTIGSSNCSINLLTFKIGYSPLTIDTSGMHIKSDVCGQALGTIVCLQVNGPKPGKPATRNHGYIWLDESGKWVGQFLYLAGVPSGKYRFFVINDDMCSSDTLTFFIPDSISSASKPIVNDIKICLPGTVGLDVLNKDPDAHYQLYDSTKTLIDTSRAGYFSRKVANTTIFYIASKKGICPSPLEKVTVTVEDPGVTVPNAFTPNNDGINDYWAVTGLENYPGTEVSVFNRYGQRVFYSVNYTRPFDGRYNGADLPSGVYYYIIDTKKPDCRGGVTGSLTIIR